MEFENMRILDVKSVLRYRAKTKRWRAENRSHHIVGVKLSGSAHHDFGSHSFVISGNCVYFLNQKDDYDVQVLEPGDAFSVHFTTTEPIRTESFCISGADTQDLLLLLEKLSRRPDSQLGTLSLVYRLCAQIVQLRSLTHFPGDRRILAAKEYLDANYRDAHCCGQAARIADLSPRRFRDLFQAHYRVTPARYQTLRRLELAKQLLQTENMSISQVSRLCGFTDVYYFSRHFKKETGLPPSRWKPGEGSRFL